MRKYRVLEKLGEGTFASVHKCTFTCPKRPSRNDDEDAIVAVKRLKQRFEHWDECKRLREVQSLTKLKHKNIIKCTEVILEKNQELYLVFEYAPRNLWQVIRAIHEPLGLARIKRITYQILDGLTYMHKHGFFHRDIKPENILLRHESHEEVIKIADFGCAREIRSRPPYTEYIATRWYRAPELLLYLPTYSSPVDLWAIGCILCELFLRKNIFPGESDINMLHLIFSKFGTPAREYWLDGKGASIAAKLPHYPGIPFKKLFEGTELEDNVYGKQLLAQLLTYDPNKRITAQHSLQHRFFSDPTLDTGNHGYRTYSKSSGSFYQNEEKLGEADEIFLENSIESKAEVSNIKTSPSPQESDIDKMLKEIKFDCHEIGKSPGTKQSSLDGSFCSDEAFEEYLDRIAGGSAEGENDNEKKNTQKESHTSSPISNLESKTTESNSRVPDDCDFESFLDDIT